MSEPLLDRVLVLLDEQFYKHQGKYHTPAVWWKFARHLANHCRKLTLYPIVAHREPPAGSNLVECDKFDIADRFHFKNTEHAFGKMLFAKRGLVSATRQLLESHDLLILRVPSPVQMPLAKLAWQMGKPTAMLLSANVRTATRYAYARGLKAFIGRRAAEHLRRQEFKLAAKSNLVVAWGTELFDLFARINHQTVLGADPSISRDSIYYRRDVLKDRPVRLVRISQIIPIKGFEYLIDALAILRQRTWDVRIDVAGSCDDLRYMQSLCSRIEARGLKEHVTFLGQLPFGEPLFEFYRRGDIHVISSLSEGLPRCVVEGRMFGLPTVATRINGLIDSIHDGKDGILVEPGNAAALADGVERLLKDPQLAKDIVTESYHLAEKHTADFQAYRLAKLLQMSLAGEDVAPFARDLDLDPGELPQKNMVQPVA